MRKGKGKKKMGNKERIRGKDKQKGKGYGEQRRNEDKTGGSGGRRDDGKGTLKKWQEVISGISYLRPDRKQGEIRDR